MKTEISLPDLGLVAMTRGMLGIGIGLLAANKLNGARKPVGLALVAVGLATTVPLLLDVLASMEQPAPRKPRVRKTGGTA
ncbi:MAG TPA: hypothetical protein VHW73_10485 [Rudaea sp.]|jgi:hypothetical protein|nr:hypothetical protein [Rudaea sp.]